MPAKIIRRSVNYAAVASIMVLSIAVVTLIGGMQRTGESWRWVVHTREVLERVQRTQTLVHEAEALHAALLLDPQEEDRALLHDRLARLPRAVDELRQLTSDNPVQQRALAGYRLTLDEFARAIDVPAGTRARYDRTRIRALDRAIDARTAALRAEEERLLALREGLVGRARARVLGAAIAVALLAIGLLLLVRWIAQRDAAALRAHQDRLEQSQHALAEANALLERRIEERTEMLVEANIELRAFAHTVAHDLRAPLRNLQGYADALHEDEAANLGERGHRYVERILAVTDRMDHLVADLLDYSQLSRAELALKPVELDRVVLLALGHVEADVEASRAHMEIGMHLPAVLGNEAILVQVFDNLFANALKFVAPGTAPEIRVAARYDATHACVIVDVQDNGIGIPPGERERVFGVFERLHGEERYPGTGIGLAIVRRAVERLGGRVEALAPPGGRSGTLFRLTLPAVPAAAMPMHDSSATVRL